jgi:hypothetical protein
MLLKTRISPFLFLIAVLCISLSITAQNTPQQKDEAIPEADIDEFREAHRELFQTQDKAQEVSRFTQEMSKLLPGQAAPAAIPRKNFIDDHIFSRIERDRIPHARLSTDDEFIRRVYLDVTGLLPSPDDIRSFLGSTDPAKRDKLIDSLIGTELFAEQWAWHYGDVFRMNEFAGPKDAFQYFIKEWLQVDRPYSEVVTDIIARSSKGHSTFPQMAFLGRIARNSAMKNRDLTDPDNYAGNVNRLDGIDEMNVEMSRIFLGTNIECISCHNGARHLETVNLYLSQRTRQEFAEQAAFFGELRIVGSYNSANGDNIYDDDGPGYNTKNDAPFFTASENRFPRAGTRFEPRFMLTGERPRPGVNPRQELARMITSHPQFSRTTVNFIWSKLMTLGFVEPWDRWDLSRIDPKNPPPQPWTVQPSNPELLEALAADFRDHRYSMHHLIKTIMKSSAYQLSSQFPSEWKESYTPYYARKYVRVMTGPEVVDTVAQATGKPYKFEFKGTEVERVKQLTNLFDIPVISRGGEGHPDGADIHSLMNAFFETNRDSPVPPGNRATTLQAMLMMRTALVNNRVLAEKGTRVQALLESGKSDEQVIEELFLANLSRFPTAAEKRTYVDLLQKDRKEAAENLQWVLLNSIEFVLNH